MNKKHIIITSIVTAVIVGGIAGALWLLRPQNPANESAVRQDNSRQSSNQSQSDAQKKPKSQPSTESQQPVNPSTGRYADYIDGKNMEHAYKKTILFFHASWCGECKAFDKVLREGPIPAGVQILKVDYDSRQDLHQKYGVTKQSTFVELDDDDDYDHDIWVGYGEEKSIHAILKNL